MSKSDLFEDTLENAARIPDGFTSPDDDWAPFLFLEGGENTIVALGGYMDNDDNKDILCEVVLPMIIASAKATKAVLVVSVWSSATSSKVLNLGEGYMPPSTLSDREELVMVTEYTREGVTRIAQAPIIRSETEVPRLGEWEVRDDVKPGSQGRFIEPIVAALKAV